MLVILLVGKILFCFRTKVVMFNFFDLDYVYNENLYFNVGGCLSSKNYTNLTKD